MNTQKNRYSPIGTVGTVRERFSHLPLPAINRRTKPSPKPKVTVGTVFPSCPSSLISKQSNHANSTRGLTPKPFLPFPQGTKK